ncbi:MAG TPA: hypothetical protein VIJ72_00305 [Rhizomicrobium sp.]
MSIAATTSLSAPAAPQVPAKSDDGWDFSFKNLLDIVNPLQHIPVISTIYRKLTGDVPATPEKIAGDTLYGGAIGFVSSLADTAFEAVTGKDFGDTVLAFFTGDDKSATPELAQNNPPAPSMGAPTSVDWQSTDSQRAAFAYRRTADLSNTLMTGTLANAY